MTSTHAHGNNDWSALAFTRADRLTKALSFAGITQQEIADDLNVSRQTIGNYISGRTRPSRAVIMAWAMRTGVPLEWIETGELPAEPTTDPAKRPLSDYKSASPAPVVSLAAFASRFSPTPVGDGKQSA